MPWTNRANGSSVVRSATSVSAVVSGTPVRERASAASRSRASSPPVSRQTRRSASCGASPATTASASRSASTGNSASIAASRRSSWRVSHQSRPSMPPTRPPIAASADEHGVDARRAPSRRARRAAPRRACRARAPHHLLDAELLDGEPAAQPVQPAPHRRPAADRPVEERRRVAEHRTEQPACDRERRRRWPTAARAGATGVACRRGTARCGRPAGPDAAAAQPAPR